MKKIGMLRHEWTEEEYTKLNRDMTVAKVKVFEKWGFTTEEIAKIMSLPESVIRAMIHS